MRGTTARRLAPLAIALAVAGGTCGPTSAGVRPFGGSGTPEIVRVEAEPFLRDVPRLGVNLGTWTAWGAEQLPAGVVPNPGLEGVLDRTIVVVKEVRATRFTDDNPWFGRADGFWAGARFDVRTGALAGVSGRIASSLEKGPSGLPEFEPEQLLERLAPGDVVALTRIDDAGDPPNWWVPASSKGRVRSSTETRPGSPGVRSVALDARSGKRAELISYLDALGGDAGKMLPVRGEWVLSFWVRTTAPPARLKASFRRGSQPELVSKLLDPGTGWNRVELPFTGKDDGPSGTLELRFSAEDGQVLLDDVELGPVSRTAGFRDEVAAALRSLSPGILRDWQGQLGDTLENRLSSPFARRSSRYRSGAADIHFHYGIPEFLDLCRSTGATPWLVASPAFSDDEWRELGRFLAGPTGAGFREILVEFGNENWNPTFRQGGIPDPSAHREALLRAGRFLAEGAGKAPVRIVANGPARDPSRAAAIARGLPADGLLAVAPYFFYRVAAGTTTGQRLEAMLAADDGDLVSLAKAIGAGGTELASAELNVHATFGDAPPEERDPIVTSAAAGTALARRALAALSLGFRRQCVYSLGGFATPLAERSGLVRLFGVTRDLAGPVHLRPTGMALGLLNRVLPGDAHAVGAPALAGLTAVAFHGGQGWSAALVSTRDAPTGVEVVFPPSGALPSGALVLAADDPLAGNESAASVAVAPLGVAVRGRAVTVRLPPRSVVALLSSRSSP